MFFRFFLVVLLVFSFSYGKTKKENVPILVEADKLVFNKKENTAKYIGNVVIKKGDITIKAGSLNIYLDKENKIKKVIAKDKVVFEKGNVKGKAQEAVLEKDTVILKGNAEIRQKNNVIKGDVIVYNLKTGNVEVKGKNKRVRTIIFPEQ